MTTKTTTTVVEETPEAKIEEKTASAHPAEIAQEAANAAEAAKTTTTTTEEAEPFYQSAGRQLDTADEAKEYIRELEQKELNRTSTEQTVVETKPEQTRAEHLADLQFSDPVKYQTEIQKDFQLAQDQRDEQKSNLVKWKEDFYRNNEDLKGHEYVVNLVQNDKINELRHLTPVQASKELAKHVRSAIKSHSPGKIEEVVTGKTTVLDSGADTGVKTTVVEKPKTFTEELMTLREGKGL